MAWPMPLGLQPVIRTAFFWTVAMSGLVLGCGSRGRLEIIKYVEITFYFLGGRSEVPFRLWHRKQSYNRDFNQKEGGKESCGTIYL